MRKMVAVLVMLLPLVCGGCGWFSKISMPKIKLSEDAPEVKVQKRIATVLRSSNDVDFHRGMADLNATAQGEGWNAERLLNEVIDYYPRVDSNIQLSVYNRMLESLHIPRSAMVAAAAPRLDAGGQAAELSKSILVWAAPGTEQGKTDYSQLAEYLRQKQAPASLVLWMYGRDPSAAMWQLVEIYGERMDSADRRTLALAEHVVSEVLWRQGRNLNDTGEFARAAADQLETLSKFGQWYVRLYVAQVISANPRLAKNDVAERLAKDENALVARVAKRS
jgi:hypothetical protein